MKLLPRLTQAAVLAAGIFGHSITSNAAVTESADGTYVNSISKSLLDGVSVVYSYLDGASYVISFRDGKFDWTAIDINFKNGGTVWKPQKTVNGSPYKAQKIDNGIYLIYFIEESAEGNKEFATIYFDFNTSQIFAGGLFNYGDKRTDEHWIHWAPGYIYQTSKDSVI